MIDLHGYGPAIMEGALLTLQVAFVSLAIALALGLAAASAKLFGNGFLRGLATLYTTIIRGIPDLVLMLLIFFGGQILANTVSDWLYDSFDIDYYININEFVAGVCTLGFIFGAYMGETFRGAFLAVEKGQIEAGYAYGMTKRQVFFRIMVPQMMRHALPGIGNNWQVLAKTTALVSIIGLADMTRVAKEAAGATHEPFTFFIPVALVYLGLTAMSELGLKALEKRYSHGIGEAH